MRRKRMLVGAVSALAAAGLVVGCGDDESDDSDAMPSVVATTGIWADVASNVACGDLAEVTGLIPTGADPHDFEPSLSDRDELESAALVVANGLGLEERLEDTLEAVEEAGTPVFHYADHVDVIEGGGHSHSEDEEGHEGEGEEHEHEDEGEEHKDEGEEHEHEGEGDGHSEGEEGHDAAGAEAADAEDKEEDHAGEEHGHDHSGGDPHIWFDPSRVAAALPALTDALVAEAGLDRAAVEACAADYAAQLEALDADLASQLGGVADARRKLVTSHDALGYLADRYDYEVIGTVIPAPTSLAETNPAQLEELAQTIEAEGVPAIFAEEQHSDADVRALAERVGDVEVVTLFTGALGEAGSGADTYEGLMRTNAQLISTALG